MKKLVVMMWAGFFGLSAGTALAQKPGVVLSNEEGWHKIGETVASFKEQDESIAVIGTDEFAAIKIRVEDAPLQIERLQVFYESGEMEEIDVKKRIAAGAESEVFRLEHPDRDIQKVAFTYNTAPNEKGEKADVKLFGLKTEMHDKSDAYRNDDDAAEEKLEETGDDIERASEKAGDDIEEGAEETESDIERAAEKTGHAISETAAKGAAEVADRRHDTKVGPQGQVIYVTADDECYYIDDRGKKVFVKHSQLKQKVD